MNLTVSVAQRAINRFDPSDNIFNTAGFQSEVKALDGTMPTGQEVAALLQSEPRIVQLSGGCHWLLLPCGYRMQA